SWNNKFVSADLSTPLTHSGNVRARFVAKKEVGDTFMDLPEDDKTVVYGVIDADITDQASLSIGSSYQNNDPTASTWGGLSSWYGDGSRTDWSRDKSSAADWTFWASTNENQFANFKYAFSNGWELKVNYNHSKNTQDAQLLYLYGAADKNTGVGLFAWPFKSDGYSKQDSVDIQLKGGYSLFGQTHEFVVGALDSDQEAKTYTYAYTSSGSVGDYNQWDGSFPEPDWGASSVAVDFNTEQQGYYAATRISLADPLKLIAGARVSSWNRTGVSYGDPQTYGDDDVVVPYTGLLYEFADNHNAYISYTSIFKPQVELNQQRQPLDSIKGNNAELGLKSAYLDGKLQTSVAVFSIKQDNLAQVAGEHDPVNGQQPEAYYREADGVESTGFEFEVIGQPLDGWNVSFGYSQFKAEDSEGAAVNTDHPRKKLNLFTTYDFSGVMDGFVVGGGISWEDKNYTDTFNGVTGAPERLQQDSFSLVSLMARYQINDQISVQFNVDNLLDETYYSQIGFFDQYGYGAPRNYTLGATYSF
ncbi:MAG TPA: TonB-dependent receptor, partial [Cellvibrio sp.]